MGCKWRLHYIQLVVVRASVWRAMGALVVCVCVCVVVVVLFLFMYFFAQQQQRQRQRLALALAQPLHTAAAAAAQPKRLSRIVEVEDEYENEDVEQARLMRWSNDSGRGGYAAAWRGAGRA
jgi:Flp pilus assembly protein TadB